MLIELIKLFDSVSILDLAVVAPTTAPAPPNNKPPIMALPIPPAPFDEIEEYIVLPFSIIS